MQSFLEKLSSPGFDFDASKSQRTKFGFAKYLDLRSETVRCLALGQFTRTGLGDACLFGGTDVLFLGVCVPIGSTVAAHLDEKVFGLVENLRIDSSGKNLVGTGGTP